jgi:hypothetical protein
LYNPQFANSPQSLAGQGFPGFLTGTNYDLSVDWIAAKQRIGEAQLRWADPESPSRVLVISGLLTCIYKCLKCLWVRA